MTRRLLLAAALMAVVPVAHAQTVQSSPITIRTDTYPRPPYSGATYYVYERGGEVVCTKLIVCNKYGACETTYRKGAYKAPEDVETGAPFGTSGPVPIPAAKLRAHVCLTRFGLL